MDISLLIHNKPPRSVNPCSGAQAAVPPNKGSGPSGLVAKVGDGSVKRSHAQMTAETSATDEDREPKKPRLSERSDSMLYDASSLHAADASRWTSPTDFKRVLMPVLGPYILGDRETATSPIPSHGEAGNIPAHQWQLSEQTHTATSSVFNPYPTARMLPPFLPSPLSFPSFNSMPCIWRAGAAQASVSMPGAATQRCAGTIMGGRTAALPGADDCSSDPHASGRFRGLYEHVKGRSSKRQEQASREKCNVSEDSGDRSGRGKVKAPVNQFNMPVTRPLPRHTDTASPLLDQLHAAELDSSVVAQR